MQEIVLSFSFKTFLPVLLHTHHFFDALVVCLLQQDKPSWFVAMTHSSPGPCCVEQDSGIARQAHWFPGIVIAEHVAYPLNKPVVLRSERVEWERVESVADWML